MVDIPQGVTPWMRLARWAFGAGAVLAAILATASYAREKPADIVAAQARTQGYACDKALRARRDRKASKPNETAWTLVCSNGSYRVILVPDMAARVAPLKR